MKTFLTALAILLAPILARTDNQLTWGSPSPYYIYQKLQNLMGLSQMLSGKSGVYNAAFMAFVGDIEARSPSTSIDIFSDLRDRQGIPIQGFFLETEHTSLSSGQIRDFVTLAESRGFSVMIRTRNAEFSQIKEYIGLGSTGLIIPLVSTTKDVEDSFFGTYFSIGRAMGFEREHAFLASATPEKLKEIDSRKILALMVETVESVKDISSLTRFAADISDKYQIPRSNIVWWWGPYDLRTDARRKLDLKGSTAEVESQLTEYVNSSLDIVSESVQKLGMSMGGHVGDLETAAKRVTSGFKIFTVNGVIGTMQGGPSLPQLFSSQAKGAEGLKKVLLRTPNYSEEEKRQLKAIFKEASRFVFPAKSHRSCNYLFGD